MNKLSDKKRAQMLSVLVEGNSLRATARICDVAFNTVLKFVPEIGKACAEYQSSALKNLTCKRIQCDEIWSFCYAKAKNVPEDKKGQFGYGDVWTWVAICADSKLVPAWLVGNRDAETASIFMEDLASRFVHKVQLTTDGLKIYLDAVEGAFGADIDYAMLVKMYGESAEAKMQKRYSPAKFTGSKKEVIVGNPERKHISTSYAERQNLTMRMSMRRFTRLTNGFSKKVENHAYQVALHYMYYNFCRIHKTLRVTPAMEAGISDHVWSFEEIAQLAD
ncbi:MAG: IS1 family transposase [Deltaproteobacteria bacterium]|nr:IS1 family transposase [Deltaproteobacteria bacterium]